jgi:hypothetical protein
MKPEMRDETANGQNLSLTSYPRLFENLKFWDSNLEKRQGPAAQACQN